MAHRASAVRVKAIRSYTVEEAAEAVGVTPQTVRSWIGQGLQALTARRPHLILGWALKEFVSHRRERRRQPLKLGEFFCFRCKAPTTAGQSIATYHKKTATHGRLEAFCVNCEGPCGRITAAETLAAWRALYEIDGNGSQ